MNRTTVLVVEDDSSIRNLIATTLKSHNYKTLLAKDGLSAILEASTHNPDVIFLDLGLPDTDGLDIIKKVRTWSALPIIVISARTEDSDKIKALDAGADDYLTKPFSVEELLARLRVVERRISSQGEAVPVNSSIFENGCLKVDYAAGVAYLDDQEMKLTPNEFKLLTLLTQQCGRVLTHDYLTKNIWGRSMESDIASLRVFMAGLRKKLDNNSEHFHFIQTHIGVGYRMMKAEK